MDRVELVSEIVELVAAVAILGAWITGHIQTDELVGQIVILVAVVAIFGDAAVKVLKLRTGNVAEPSS